MRPSDLGPSGPKALPSNDAAERAVLGSILVDDTVLAEVADILRPEDFQRPPHRWVYAAAMRLWSHGEAVSIAAVQAELERQGRLEQVGGVTYLTRLAMEVAAPSQARHHAQLVLKAAQARRMVEAAWAAQAAAMAGNLEEAMNAAGRILDAGVERGVEGEDLYQTAYLTLDAIQQRQATGVQEATPTGLVDLDELLDGGLWPSELSIVAARPGTGKTAFLLTVAHHVAREGKPVLFYSLEQSRRQLALRVVASETGTNASLLRKGWLSQTEWEAIYQTVLERSEVPLHVVDTPRLTVEQMLAYARVMQRRRGLALVLVDYLQIVEEPRVPGQTRAEQVGEISRKIKAMAMELDVPVLCAAQLNRRAEETQRPTLSDLRESGAIEQDADVVLFLWRDSAQHESLVRCTIGKQRNGAVGEVPLVFLRHVQRFTCAAQPGRMEVQGA